jgi:hypothetical protein
MHPKQVFPSLGRNLQLSLALLCIGAVLGGYLWRCQFSLDTYDEAYYLSPAFNLMPQGDLPFRNEINNAPRHFDLLNYFLVRPWASYSVLAFRHTAVLVYAFLLLVYVLLWFRGRLGLTATVTFLACLLFDIYHMPTWSHNWWYRNLLLLHHTFLILSFHGKKWRTAGVVLSGLMLGLVCVAYSTEIASLLLVPLVVWTARPFFKNLDGKLPLLRFYLLASLFPIALDLAYLAWNHLGGEWWDAFKTVALIPDYSGNSTFGKGVEILHYLLIQKDLWALVLLGTIAHAVSAGRFVSPRWGPLFFVGTGLYLWRRLGIIGNPSALLGGFIGWMTASAFLTLGSSLSRKDPLLFLLTTVSTITALIAAFSSHAGPVSLLWAAPSLVIPAAALLQKSLESVRTPPARILQGGVTGFIALVALGAMQSQLTTSYRDVAPKNCTRAISVPPYQGIRTNPRRAFLVDSLSRALKGKHLVLSYPNLPGVFLFPGIRSAADTTLVNFAFPPRFDLSAIKKMILYRRYPEAVVKVRVEPWTWGNPPENVLALPEDRPLVKFSECIRGKTVLKLPEFEVFEATQDTAEACAKKSLESWVVVEQ